MSQNVPALAVLILLCAPGLVWSEEPSRTNDPHLGKGYFDSSPHVAGTGVMQDRNKSPVIKLMPLYSVSNHQNLLRSAPEKSHFGSGYKEPSQHIPAYVVRPPQTIFKTILPHGISSQRAEGSNSPRINSVFRVGSNLPQGSLPQREEESNTPIIHSPSPMISSIASAEQRVSSGPLTTMGGSALNKIPIYVIRPPLPGMASPTLVNMALLPQEQINPDIIKILQSLRLSQDKVPLVLVTGPLPALTIDSQTDEESGINTVDFNSQDPSSGGRRTPMIGIISPHLLSEEKWHDEMIKQEYQIRGGRPSSSSRFAPISPQLYGKSGVPSPAYLHPLYAYQMKHPDNDPMNTERFVVPRENSSPVNLFPAGKLTQPEMRVPGGVWTNNRYPSQEQSNYPHDLRQLGLGDFSDSQRYEPIQEPEIPKYPYQYKAPYNPLTPRKSLPDRWTRIPQLSSSFLPNIPEKTGSEPLYAPRDSDLGPQYLPYPSSEVQEPHNSSFPSQELPYSHQYDDRNPSDFQPKQSPEFPSYTGRAPVMQAPTDVFLQIERLTIPETPSQDTSIYPERVAGSPPPNQLYAGHQPQYPTPQAIPQLMPLHFPLTGQSPDYHDVTPPQYPSPVGERPQLLPQSNILSQVGKMMIPHKQNSTFYQFPSTSTDSPSDLHIPFPHQSYPDQEAMYPFSNLVPLSPVGLDSPLIHPMSDYDERKMQSRPERPPQVGKVTETGQPPPKQVAQSIPYHGDTFPLQEHPQHFSGSVVPDYTDQIPRPEPQYPSTDDEEHVTSINALDMPTDVDEPSSPRPNVVLGMEKLYIPGKHKKIPKPKYPPHPSLDAREPTNYSHQPFITLEYPSDEQVLARPEQPYKEDSSSVRPLYYVDAGINKLAVPEQSIIKPQQEYQPFPSADDQKQIHYPDSTPQQAYKEPQSDFFYEDQNSGYLWNPTYEEEPQIRLRPDVVSTIEKTSLPEVPYSPGNLQVAPSPEYPTFDSQPHMKPRTDIVSTTVDKFSIPEQPYSKPQQTYPHGSSQQPYRAKEVDFKMWPKDFAEPEMRPRPDVASDMEIISVTEQPYTNTQRKYPRIASSDTDGSIYYPNDPFKQPYQRQLPELQLREYPHTPTDGKEPQMKPRTNVVSTLEKTNLPEHPFNKPKQKYIQTEEPTIHFDGIPHQSYTSQSSNNPLDSQPFYDQTRPIDGTEPEGLEKPNVVSKIEKLTVPEQSYYMPEEKYPLIPSSASGKPSYYPDTNLQLPLKVQYPDYPSDGFIGGYPEYPIDNTQPQIKHRPQNVEKLSIPDSSSQLPSKKQLLVFPTDGHVVDYSTHPTEYMGPQIKPKPNVFSMIQKIIIPEQSYPKQKYPFIPSSEMDKPTYRDSSPELNYRGHLPNDQLEDKVVEHPHHPSSSTESLMRPRPDIISKMEVISRTGEPYPSTQQNYPLVPTSETGDPTYYPDSGPQHPSEDHNTGMPSESQVGDYPLYPTSVIQPLLKPRPAAVSSIETISMTEPTHSTHQQKYSLVPSSGDGGSTHYPDETLRGYHPSHFPLEGQVTDYSTHSTDAREAQVKARPDVISNMETISIFEQPYTKPYQKYPLISSPETDEPTIYSESNPQRPVASYPEYPTDVPSVRPIPEIFSNIEKFSMTEQPHPIAVQKYPLIPFTETDEPTKYSHRIDQQPDSTYPEYPISLHPIPHQKHQHFPSSDANKFTIYPEIRSQERNAGLVYPGIPASIPGSTKHPLDSSKPTSLEGGPRPVVSSEVLELNIPEGQPVYKGQQPEFPSKVHIPDFSIHSSHKEPSINRMPWLGKQPFEDSPAQIVRPHNIGSEVRKFYVPENYHPTPDETYPPSHTDVTRRYPDEGPQPFKPNQQHQSPPESHIPRPNVPVQIEKLYITEKPQLGQIGKYPQYPSSYRDYYAGPQDALKPQYVDQPQVQDMPEILSQIGKFDIPIQGSPQYPLSGSSEPNELYRPEHQMPLSHDRKSHIPTDFQDHTSFQYPSSSKPSWISPATETHTNGYEVPRGTGSIATLPYPHLDQPSSDNKFPKQLPPLRYDISVPTEQPQQELPQYPSYGKERIPERPIVLSKTEVLQISETPELRPLQKGYQFPESSPSPSLPRTPITMDAVEVEKQLHPRKESVSLTTDILANVERFKIPEGLHPRTGQEYPTHFPGDGSLPKAIVSGSNLRPSNDIDINIERITVQGQRPRRPLAKYPQYPPSTGTQKPDEYPETYSPYPGQVHLMLMKPEQADQPVGGDLMPENSEHNQESTPYPYKTIYAPSNQPRVTVEVKKFNLQDQPLEVPTQKYHPYSSTESEPEQYPSVIYQSPIKKSQPHIAKTMDTFDITESPDSQRFETWPPLGSQEQPTFGSAVSYFPPGFPQRSPPQRLHTVTEESTALNLDYGGSQGPVGDEPKESANPTVYVYPVPKRSGVPPPESYGPQLERRLLGTPLVEPYGYSVSTSPSMLQSTSSALPEDFPNDLTRSVKGQPQHSGSITYLPHGIGNHEPTTQTPSEGYAVETVSEPSIQGQYTTPSYQESFPRQSVVLSTSPDGPMLHLEPSARETTGISLLAYPTKTVVDNTPERIILQPASERVLQIALDGPRKVNLNGQPLDPQKMHPVEEVRQPSADSSSVNTIDFPQPTEGAVNEQKPGSTTLPSVEENVGFYPDNSLTTTGQTIEPTRDESPQLLSTQVPIPTSKKLLDEPLSGDADLSSLSPTSLKPGTSPVSSDFPKKPSIEPDSKITRIFPVTKPTFYTDKDGQKFVSLKLLNEPIPASPAGDIISRELTDSTQHPGTTDLIIPIGQEISDTPTPSPSLNTTQSHPMLEGIPIGNVQVFDAQAIIKVIENCNCSNLKFLIPILKRPQSAIVVANNEHPATAN